MVSLIGWPINSEIHWAVSSSHSIMIADVCCHAWLFYGLWDSDPDSWACMASIYQLSQPSPALCVPYCELPESVSSSSTSGTQCKAYNVVAPVLGFKRKLWHYSELKINGQEPGWALFLDSTPKESRTLRVSTGPPMAEEMGKKTGLLSVKAECWVSDQAWLGCGQSCDKGQDRKCSKVTPLSNSHRGSAALWEKPCLGSASGSSTNKPR